MSNRKEFRVLVVDDEVAYLDVYEMLLDRKGYKTDRAASGEEALGKLARQRYDLVLTDLIMGGMDGLELLSKVKRSHPQVEVIMITGYGSIDSAVEAMKRGAFSYFIKSADPKILLGEIDKLTKLVSVVGKDIPVRADASVPFMLQSKNPRVKRIMEMIGKVAASNASVLITGESGVGKEVFAYQLHSRSLRKGRKFVAVNCQALSESLLESELFGHERGSFTGANERRIGRFEEADGGTLFLDEIGEMPVETQVKLLRVLETKRIERIGNNAGIPVDLRLISATNRNIMEAIRSGHFREDLLYRINTIVLEIPPLRDRREDIPGLMEFFLAKYSAEYGKEVVGLEPEVGEFMRMHDYPGNIRELKNIVERLVVLSDDGMLRASDLPGRSETGMAAEELTDVIMPLRDLRREVEKKHIASVLGKYGGNITEAARHLCISRRQLFNKVVEYELKF